MAWLRKVGGRVQRSLQDLCGGQAGVDHAEPLRLGDGKLAIRRAHALEKGVGLDLDAIGLAATGGSTNHAIHLVAMARTAGLRITWDDLDELSRVADRKSVV